MCATNIITDFRSLVNRNAEISIKNLKILKKQLKHYGKAKWKGSEKMTQEEEMKIREAARNYLCGYQLCLDMLKLRKYERKRAAKFDELCDCEDILAGDEAYWKARIYEIAAFLGKMKNGREKMLLYYRYVKGESVERAASLLGLSRRTAYRLWNRALLSAGLLLARNNQSFDT